MCQNLPLPQANTVRKFDHYLFSNIFICKKTEIVVVQIHSKLLFLTVNYINNEKQTIIEGELRCEQLAQYLEKMNAPKVVWISEDGTGIVKKVSYHNSSGQLVGLVLPLNLTSGMPIPHSFVPQTANDIALQMKKTQSTSAYVVMAQSIKEGVPPFVLQIFGTNNTFTTENMFQRWSFTKTELSK